MSSKTTRPSGRYGGRQQDHEDPYGSIPAPKQSHIGYFLAFASVLVVLGFGFWTALGTVTSGDNPAPKASPAAAATASPVTTAVPTAAAAAPGASPSAAATRPAATPSPGSGRVHVVGEKDTLYAIAQKYNTTIEAIMAANGFTDRNKILHIGDRLNIP